MYTVPCKPQFYYIKVVFKGVKIIKVCFRDAHFAEMAITCLSLRQRKKQVTYHVTLRLRTFVDLSLNVRERTFCVPTGGSDQSPRGASSEYPQ